MKIRATETSVRNRITEGRTYEAVGEDEEFYHLASDDSGEGSSVYKRRFEFVKEPAEDPIKYDPIRGAYTGAFDDHEALTFHELPIAAKDTNPKDAVGTRKAPMSTVSAPVLAEVGVAMLEGAVKYGRHNYRAAGVRASVYYDATMRHLMAWWEGQDTDPDSGMSHITKAITSLVVLRDSMLQGNWQDDRPPVSPEFYERLNKLAGDIIDRAAAKGMSPTHFTEADRG